MILFCLFYSWMQAASEIKTRPVFSHFFIFVSQSKDFIEFIPKFKRHRHEICDPDHLNYCDQPWRSIRWQEISKHDLLNYCDRTWRSFRLLALTLLVYKTYCDNSEKMLSEVFVIIIYANKYAVTTCNKTSCQTWWKNTMTCSDNYKTCWHKPLRKRLKRP